jgi:ribosomal protein S18 acetylase RimI-like enzyme
MPKAEVSIRVAWRHESDICADIYRAAWRGMAFVPQDLHTDAEDRRWMRDVLRRQLVLVAETPAGKGQADGQGRIVGLLSMSDGTVHNLYVQPGYQGRGIGRQLIETAKSCSGGQLQLWVFEPNVGAIRFYERHGFVTVRKTDGQENEEKVPDRLMAWRAGQD